MPFVEESFLISKKKKILMQEWIDIQKLDHLEKYLFQD